MPFFVVWGFQTSMELENCKSSEQDDSNNCFVCGKVRYYKSRAHKEEKQPKAIVNPALLEFLELPKEKLQERRIFTHTACQNASQFMPFLGK